MCQLNRKRWLPLALDESSVVSDISKLLVFNREFEANSELIEDCMAVKHGWDN